ncbi:cullin-associated NEDD8-dissociated protein [Verticillium alfalfae VaMs.102]|uniref:Cullin-associated NEDD8-dissociated protein n=1 Tax=Verticillium alfalfae (strain VaMs.102 / ATCC MYA-4576 / FGSC 10136) TaxID=526221 RepID=C9SNQ4_VERA1|nr:cullin-associated NEDD8-dissociated protein [Verticillium alfalfae VaMs.102]EEY20419.1 cullin-associated NEDD8-dissociated protein [Verticillium alfalfae VaMs.102]
MTTTVNATPQAVMSLVTKLSESDPDYRFMALNDLIALFEKGKPDFLHHDYNVAARTVDSIIRTLDDQNGEVQNLAIKSLGPLVTRVPSNIIAPMLEKLSSIKLRNSVDNAVPSLALRAAIMSLPRPTPGVPVTRDVQEAYTAVSRVLIPRMVGPGKLQPSQSKVPLPNMPEGILQSDADLNAESVDVLIEIVRSFGPMLLPAEIDAMQDTVISILEHDRGSSVVKKRAVVAVSILASHLSEQLLEQMVSRMAAVLAKPDISAVTRRLYITISGSVARSTPHRFGPHLQTLAPFLFKALGEEELAEHLEAISDGDDLGQDFNDVREAALTALEAFLASCPAQMEAFTNETIIATLRFLRYDPNSAVDDDEEEMDVDEEDDFEDEEDFDMGGEFDDDDDASWKEREENVRLEIISCLALLVRKTGEDLYPGSAWNLDNPDDEAPSQAPINRKRRRQSSVAEPGAASPVLEKAPATGPRADLVRLTPSIVKASNKLLKGKVISTKQAIFSLFDDIVKVQRGGLSDYFGDIMGPTIEAVKSTGSAGLLIFPGSSWEAAHPPHRELSALLPFGSSLVAAVVAAVNDRFYKISCEAMRTVEELVRNITPPRSGVNAQKFKSELQSLYDIIFNRITQAGVDTEVRQRAIQALGVLLARTISSEGSSLIPAEKRRAAMDVLADRVKSETTRLASVRAIDTIASYTTSPGQLEKSWIQDVALELAAQLRKSNRALRTSSIQGLKHLVSSPTSKGQLEPETIKGLVSSLGSVVSNNDTHLLAPALLVLAQLVEENAALVMTPEMTNTLCELLKSAYASIALDQLLILVNKVGESGTGQPLMNGLLQTVSIEGDPVVVGKVIGTLLVASGKSTGVTLDSFISELQTSSQTKDDARVSLALAVLGEAGLRLGAKSPLQPDLFLKQFHGEPDNVSMAAAVALGRAGSGHVAQYLPVILETMKKGGNTQYLLIQSIKEILHLITAQSVDIRQYAEPIWQQLLAASTNPENTVVCAECVGRLVIVDPKTYMPALQSLLKDSSSGVRGMAVQAVRYTLPDSDDALDAMFRDVLLEMLLTMLDDAKMDNRRLAMSTLNSAAHNKPDLILPHLGQLMPFVLVESKVKPELIREVQMGPFKHYVDDGIEVRKSAYEMLYALMETAYARINKLDLYDRIIAGLKDDNDIRALCNLMVTKLVVMDPEETTRRLDALAEAYRGVLATKLKEGSVKQEVEKQQEANRSVLRVTLLLADRITRATGGGVSTATAMATATTPAGGQGASGTGSSATWDAYWEWVNKDFQPQLKQLREESELHRAKHV